MKIILSGYGKMGKEIEKLALQKGHTIHLVLDNNEDCVKHAALIKDADVAIDFSTPQSVVENIFRFFEAGVPVVTGTTGWNHRFEEVKEECIKKKCALFFAPNFSIGVNILFSLNKKLAEIMKSFPQYDVNIEEIHHTQKLDSPSGTAIALANDIIKKSDIKEKWVNEPSGFNNFLEIKSVRKDNITGTHTVSWFSDNDTIEIKHCANNRSGFVSGAIMAAEWIVGKKGIFGMDDMLKNV